MRECPIATSELLRPQLMLIGRNRQLHNSADDVRDVVLGIVCRAGSVGHHGAGMTIVYTAPMQAGMGCRQRPPLTPMPWVESPSSEKFFIAGGVQPPVATTVHTP